MKILLDFFPLIIFFAAFKLYDIFVATAAAIVATFIQIAVMRLKHRRFEPMHLITLAIITVFGGLTILLHDDVFIKWKPTIVNWIFSLVILAMQFTKKSALEYVMGSQISLPATAWRNLNLSWAAFFLSMGGLNLYVAFFHNLGADPEIRTEVWVNFKVFWMFGLTLVFAVGQFFFLYRYLKDDAPSG
ncbi:MAG: septation protein A [Gammaproteobacteria bacterium]|nr:septation protein A [Gammaproteobacteria bacterium]MYD76772.1 septation protein A [Gammaproteobacteria bacterium]MYJ51890.1 septation protein A [Gammaproteobacteria bacterium]